MSTDLPGTLINNNGFNFFVPPYGADPVLDCIRSGAVFEPEVILTCQQYITPGSEVVDLGCNYGQMTLHFSRMTGPSGVVHSVEASDFVFSYLEKTVQNNPELNNIRLYHAAAWNELGHELKMNIATGQGDNYHSGAGIRYVEDEIYNHMTYHVIPSLTVDSMQFQNRVSLIKVDIQGSDLYALQGAKNTILAHKPVLVFEYEHVCDRVFDVTWEDYQTFLREINYNIAYSVNNNNHDFVCTPGI
jgi:FkbM family methyltransferase